MKVIFSTLAKQELEDAAHHYELEHECLGRRFKAEVKEAARRIARYPHAWSFHRGEIRKCLLHKFPYKLMHRLKSRNQKPSGPPRIDEILVPVREQFAKSGMTEEELDALISNTVL
jgi:plasmid stabilization system protein ParE